ncbi:MAG: hypothetical protein AAB177_01815 [Nitrospirota bacterium]
MALPIGVKIVGGKPEQVAKVAASHTGRFLAGALMPATANKVH